MNWYDGGAIPDMPIKAISRDAVAGRGILFTGEKGWLLADYGLRIVGLNGDMTTYRALTREELIPTSRGHYQEWIHACKTGDPTTCNFDYSGALIEHNLLGAVAFRTGEKLDWSADSLKATNCPAADQYIKKSYRDGWALSG